MIWPLSQEQEHAINTRICLNPQPPSPPKPTNQPTTHHLPHHTIRKSILKTLERPGSRRNNSFSCWDDSVSYLKINFCQAQFLLASSEPVKLRTEISLNISVTSTHPPHPTRASIFEPLIHYYLRSWNLVGRPYSNKLGHIANWLVSQKCHG